MSDTQPIHATLAARYTPTGWCGALIRGPSGAGKSMLALALIDKGWRLVADDRVLVWRSGGRVWGRAPAVLHGRLEVRGVGVVPYPALDSSEITHVIDAHSGGGEIERIPGPNVALLCGVSLPTCILDLAAPGAAAKVAAFCGALRV